MSKRHTAVAAVFLVSALGATPATAAITLTGEVIGGVDPGQLRVGDEFTMAFSIDGLPGERLTSGGAMGIGYTSAVLTRLDTTRPPSFNDDAATNPVILLARFRASAPWTGFVYGFLRNYGSTVGPVTSETAPIYFTIRSAVPEPAGWAMMIAGFALVGGALRRRRAVRTTVRYA